MPTNTFFSENYSSAGEQSLMNDLVIEVIKRYGIDVYYMPRTHVNIDPVFVEDPLNSFNSATPIEMYVKNFMGYGGESDIMSKFGISMADQIQFCLSRDRFKEDIGSQFNMVRPLEGDLLYLKMTNSIYEIKFVEHESNFYQTGHLNFYEIHCERFNYSDEDFNTGNLDIDAIEPKYTDAVNGFILISEDGQPIIGENGNYFIDESYGDDDSGQNDVFDSQAKGFINFSKTNPFASN